MQHTLFISDLHLSAERADIAQCFFEFMQYEAPKAEALYILGDLFEVWLGDDDKTCFSKAVAESIAEVALKIPVYFIHGNRDFAIGEKFAAQANMQLLPEQYVIDLYGQQTLISHGDELCTRDIAYMKFRKKARGWWWPRLMLAIPLPLRKRLAQRGRQTSKNNQKILTADIMDVTQSEVEKAMRQYDVSLFIHGHTHRPNIHEFDLPLHGAELSESSFSSDFSKDPLTQSSAKSRKVKRIVLGDWYSQGSVLIASHNQLSLQARQFAK